MEKNGLKKGLLFISLFCAFVFFIRMTGKYIMISAAPLIAAYLISLAIRPAASRISGKFRVRQRFVSAFLVIALIMTIMVLISYLFSVAAEGIRRAADDAASSLSEDDNIIKRAYDMIEDFASSLSYRTDASSVYNAIVSASSAALEKISSFAASAAGALAGVVPRLCLAFITSVIATFYICVDRGEIAKELSCFIGKDKVSRLLEIKDRIDRASLSYI